MLEKDGHSISPAANIPSANDAEIIEKAKQLIDGKTVEVRAGDRLVAAFPPSE